MLMSDNSISGKHLPWKGHINYSVCLKNVDIVLLYVNHAYHMRYETSSLVKGAHVSFLNAPNQTDVPSQDEYTFLPEYSHG